MNKVFQVIISFQTETDDRTESYGSANDLAEANKMVTDAMSYIAERKAEYEAECIWNEMDGDAYIVSVDEDSNV